MSCWRRAKRLPPGSARVELIGAYCSYHGDDSYRARLAPLLAQAAVRAHGAAASPPADVRAALANLDVLVVPSMWPENSPLVIREAFLGRRACGGVPNRRHPRGDATA